LIQRKNSNVQLVGMNKTWRCRSLRIFFGLDNKYIENIYEQMFALKYHGGWSFTELYNLPVGLRIWFVERLQKQFDDEAEEMRKARSKSR